MEGFLGSKSTDIRKRSFSRDSLHLVIYTWSYSKFLTRNSNEFLFEAILEFNDHSPSSMVHFLTLIL